MADIKKKTPKKESVDRAKAFLIKAIHKNDCKTLDRIMKAGYPPEEPIAAYGEQTPLMYTASVGQPEVLQALLNYGASMKTKDTVGRSVLHYCCRGGNIQNLRVLTTWVKSQGLDIGLLEQRTHGGVTPLMSAIQSANVYMVGSSLNASFNPFSKDFSGKSCTDYASPFKDVNGENIKNLILTAQEQWKHQLPAEQIEARSALPISQIPEVFLPFYQQIQPEEIAIEAMSTTDEQSTSQLPVAEAIEAMGTTDEQSTSQPPVAQAPLLEQPAYQEEQATPGDETKMDED